MLAKAVFRVHERLGEGRWDFTLKQALRCPTRMGLCTTWSDCVLSTAVGDRSIKMWSTRPLADPAAMCASFWVASAELSSTNAHPQNWGTRGTESQAKGQLCSLGPGLLLESLRPQSGGLGMLWGSPWSV